METSLTSALIIRRSPGVAVCRPEKHTHMCLQCKAAEACRVDKMCMQLRGKSLALLANSNNHKITFLLSPSHTKGQVFSPPLPLLPPLFFFFPQPHTIVNTMMAALKHWSGIRTGLLPQCTFFLC